MHIGMYLILYNTLDKSIEQNMAALTRYELEDKQGCSLTVVTITPAKLLPICITIL